MNSENYWRGNAKKYEQEWQDKIKSELEPLLAKYFRQAFIDIEKDIAAMYALFAKDNKLSYPDARKPLRGKDFSEWRMTLSEYLAESHTNSNILKKLNVFTRRLKISRLENFYCEILMELQNLGEKSERAVKDFLTAAYKDRYYQGVFDLVKVGNLEIPISKVQPANCEKILEQKWEGGNYSSRIWRNTEKVSIILKDTIAQGLRISLIFQKMSKLIEPKINTGFRNIERLVRTELNFVQNYAVKESL